MTEDTISKKDRSPRGRFCAELRNIMGSSAGPYGYTLSVWGTGSSMSHIYGSPSTLQVFAFLLGAVLTFSVVGALIFGGPMTEFGSPANNIELWGSFHFLSVGLAVGAASLVAFLTPSVLGWSLGAASATVTYLVLVGVQHSAADVSSRSSEEDAT